MYCMFSNNNDDEEHNVSLLFYKINEKKKDYWKTAIDETKKQLTDVDIDKKNMSKLEFTFCVYIIKHIA